MHIYLCIHTGSPPHTHTHTLIYIYIYLEREREKSPRDVVANVLDCKVIVSSNSNLAINCYSFEAPLSSHEWV